MLDQLKEDSGLESNYLIRIFASQGAAKQMNKAFLSHVSHPPSVQRTQGVVKGQVFK